MGLALAALYWMLSAEKPSYAIHGESPALANRERRQRAKFAACSTNRCSESGSSWCSLAQRSRSFRAISSETSEPNLRKIKANDAKGIAVLAFQQIADASFKIGVFNVCLAPGTTHSAEVIENEIDIPVDAGDDDGEARLSNSTQPKVIQKAAARIGSYGSFGWPGCHRKMHGADVGRRSRPVRTMIRR